MNEIDSDASSQGQTERKVIVNTSSPQELVDDALFETSNPEGSEGERSGLGTSDHGCCESDVVCQCGQLICNSPGKSEDEGASYSEDLEHCLLPSYYHYLSCQARGTFPLEKLPPEIRRIIFRFAMPDDRARPLHSFVHDWNDPCDYYVGEDGVGPLYRSTARDRIPTNLFRTSSTISAEAIRILYNDTFLRLDVSPFGIHARGLFTDSLQSWDNHQVLGEWKPFDCMRNYHLNIKANAFSKYIRDGGCHRHPPDFETGLEEIQEWLRLICDEISAHNIIKYLRVTAPCECALKEARLIPEDLSSVLDLSKPLKRLRLATPVRVSLHHDVYGHGSESQCTRKQCLELSRRLKADVGRLCGENLSREEAIWKDLKLEVQAEKHSREFLRGIKGYGWSDIERNFELEEVWMCLNGGSNCWYVYGEGEPDGGVSIMFDKAVQYTLAQLAESEAEIKRFKVMELVKRYL